MAWAADPGGTMRKVEKDASSPRKKAAADGNDHRACKRCGGEMVLYRTGPHPKYTHFEVQRFECQDCRAQFARTVAA